MPQERLTGSLCVYFWGCCPPSRPYLGAIFGHLGTILAHLGSIWAHLGSILAHLGAILGPQSLPKAPTDYPKISFGAQRLPTLKQLPF